jgi:hypothetical protein
METLDSFPIQNDRKQGQALTHFFYISPLEYVVKMTQ